jgi:DNA-binding response OmpR family regulator
MTKRILLIDDEPDITFTVKDILEDNGFQVDSFNDPILALNYYKVNFYDLVILDIKMPTMDGFQLFNKLREKDFKVKICLFTATAMFTEEIKKALLALDKTIEKDYFIQKPIRTEVLLKKITLIMNKNKQ